MVTGLDIADMGFGDIVDETGPGGSFEPDTGNAQTGLDADFKRQKALQEFRDGGYAD